MQAEGADATEASLRGASSVMTRPEFSMTSLVQTRTKTRKQMSRDPERLVAYVNTHQEVESAPEPKDILASMLQGIHKDSFNSELHDLIDSRKSRFVGTEGNTHMADTIKKKFEDMGLTTSIQDLSMVAPVKKYVKVDSTGKGAGYGGNVIGVLKGTDLAKEVVILGAHYDSVNWEQTGAAAPGVDDNGSGTTLVQLVARALAHADRKPRRTLMFVGFNAEEEGLVGSDQMAEKAAEGNYGDACGWCEGPPKAVLIADEVAYPGEGYPSGAGNGKAIFETLGTVPGADMLVDTFAHHSQFEPGIKGIEINKEGFGSDHMSYLKRNIPALLLIERNNMAHADKWGHSARDDFDHVNSDYGAAMSRLMLRVAHALGSPADTSAASVVDASPHVQAISVE